VDRKDLLLEEATSKRELSPDEERKLKKAVDDGGTYLALVNSPGWKQLYEEYIQSEISQDRYLAARTEDLADIRAAQRALFHLLRFIALKIEGGKESYELLKNSK